MIASTTNKTSLRKISLGCQHNKCPNNWLRDCRHIGNQLPMVQILADEWKGLSCVNQDFSRWLKYFNTHF